MKIVITNTKGGVGKTTTAIYLAKALSATHTVEVLDADPQGSATEWAIRAEENNQKLPFEVRPVNIAQLKRITNADKIITIIDTAPGDTRGIDAALEGADLVIIPTASSAIDMSRVWETEAVASKISQAYVLLTQVDARTRSYATAFEVLEQQGVGYFETAIPRRESIRQSFGTRPTELYGYDKAAAEILLEN